MKVVHVISSISREGGGPSRSSQALVAALEGAGCETWLLVCKPGETAWVAGVRHFAAPEAGEPIKAFFARQFAAIRPDLIHLHGIWDWSIHLAAVAARRLRIPYIIAPRGSLEPWCLEQKKWKKRLALALYQRRDLKAAVALHATAPSEAAQFRRLGFTQTIIESPNGVIVPSELPARAPADGVRRALFVSRMHPKKGVLELVEAWARVKPAGWACELVYTTNGAFERQYEEQVKARVRDLGLEDAFIFTGPLMDEAKWTAYRRADLFVLPTHSENFGIVVAEALWAGVPVVTTKGTPWAELAVRRCGWWVDIGVEPLADALRQALGLSDEERREMGARGRELVEEKYRWPAIGRQMRAAYAGLLGEGRP